ncbi:MAG: hypothetical protein NTZ56_22340 [Acidobacteria bacterium]|nr:hypothetical protein [Acidobacteriota bacterium]
MFLPGLLLAQEYTISTIAGGGPPATPVAGTAASIGQPYGVATDRAGNVFFSSLNCVFKLDADGVMTRVAGTSRPGFSGDGGPATSAQLFGLDPSAQNPNLSGLAVDAAGNLFIADSGNHRIRRVTPAGIVTTVAGNGTQGFSGDGGPATSGQLGKPSAVAVDAAGNLFIADSGNDRIRRVTPDGFITTVALVGGPATSVPLRSPTGVALDAAGNLFIADSGNRLIRRATPSGVVTTVAGGGTNPTGDGRPATSVQLDNPSGVAVDAVGNLFIADAGNNRVRRVTPDGIITAVALGGGPATTGALAIDTAGNLFITGNLRLRRVAPDGSITTVAGNGSDRFSGDGGPATSAQLDSPYAVSLGAAGNLFIADRANHSIRRVTPAGMITTVVGNGIRGFAGDGGPATSAQLDNPSGVAVDAAGNLLISDSFNQRIRRVTPDGIITTVAGTGSRGASGDGGPAIRASFSAPYGLAFDAAGNLFIADLGNARIRRVTPSGIITTVAGNGNFGFSGDGGPATRAELEGPVGVAVDSSGNLFIADFRSNSNCIRRVTPSGIITTVAGDGTAGFSGDGGPATRALLNAPTGVAVDAAGNLFIADSGNNRIRRVTPDGIISTVAGDGSSGYSGDGGPATNARLNQPHGVLVDPARRIYIADSANHAIRLLTPNPATCTYSTAPTALVAPASGSRLDFAIQTTAGCAWTLTGLPTWATASATFGNGPATVTLSIPANTGDARSATFSVGGALVTLTQAAAPCIFTIAPGGQAFSSAPGTGSILVTTAAGCAWTVTNSLPWVLLTTATSGNGTGTVGYSVIANFGASRNGILTVAGRPFTVEQLGVSAVPLSAAGTLGQVASGGGWRTTFTFLNTGTASAVLRLSFVSDPGTELTLPLSFPQTGTGPILASTLERTLAPGGLLVIDCEGPITQDTQQGWAQLVTSSSAVTGFAVFRQRNGSADQEAVVPLETRAGSNGFVLAFDNTDGVQTGIAIANISTGGALPIIIRDEGGAELLSTTLALGNRAHTAFVLSSLYPITKQKRGTIELRPAANGQLSVLGLRFLPAGAFSTIPPAVK